MGIYEDEKKYRKNKRNICVQFLMYSISNRPKTNNSKKIKGKKEFVVTRYGYTDFYSSYQKEWECDMEPIRKKAAFITYFYNSMIDKVYSATFTCIFCTQLLKRNQN